MNVGPALLKRFAVLRGQPERAVVGDEAACLATAWPYVQADFRHADSRVYGSLEELKMKVKVKGEYCVVTVSPADRRVIDGATHYLLEAGKLVGKMTGP